VTVAQRAGPEDSQLAHYLLKTEPRIPATENAAFSPTQCRSQFGRRPTAAMLTPAQLPRYWPPADLPRHFQDELADNQGVKLSVQLLSVTGGNL
jgi:hypothetical protein